MYKVISNILLLSATYITPLYMLYTYQDSAIKMGKIQTPALSVLFFGAVVLIYLNNKYRKQAEGHKWLWITFEVIGVLGLLYSGLILWLIYAFRHLGNF